MRKVNKKETLLSILTVFGVFGVLAYGIISNIDRMKTIDSHYIVSESTATEDEQANSPRVTENQEIIENGSAIPEIKIIETADALTESNKKDCSWSEVPNYGTEERTKWYKSCNFALDDSTPKIKASFIGKNAIANEPNKTIEIEKISN